MVAERPIPAARTAYTRGDFALAPFVVFYETTRACDLVCRHCRACAQAWRHPEELSTAGARHLLDELAGFPKKPVLVFTGGDPIKRPDIRELVRHAADAGLSPAMTPSATPLVTFEVLRDLREAGLERLAVSLDGADAKTHDAFRGVPGSFDRTLEVMADARTVGFPLQVNTTITCRNVDQLDRMADLLAGEGIALWSVFFLIPVGRGAAEQSIPPERYEEVFAKLWDHARGQPFAIKTTEAPHYRRFVLRQHGDPVTAGRADAPGRTQRAPLGVNDGKGILFISHIGEICPSGFLPTVCGRFPRESVIDVYQNHTMFRALRDSDRLGGKCGACEYRHVCGGSRARAAAVTGDPFAAEPDCVYLPARWMP